MVPSKCGTGPVTVTIDAELYSNPGPTFTYDYITVVTLVAGTPGISGNSVNGVSFTNTKFNSPTQVAVDNLNNIFVLDKGNAKVRKLDPLLNQSITVFSGGYAPTSIVTDKNNICYVSDYNISNDVASTYSITPGATSGLILYYDATWWEHVSATSDGAGKFYVARRLTSLSEPVYDVAHHTSPSSTSFVSLGAGGDVIFFKNPYLYQLQTKVFIPNIFAKLSRFSIADSTETILINVGTGLNQPKGLVVNDNGDIFVSDIGNNKIIKYSGGVAIDIVTGLNSPEGMAIDKEGNIYFAETGNHCIKKITFE